MAACMSALAIACGGNVSEPEPSEDGPVTSPPGYVPSVPTYPGLNIGAGSIDEGIAALNEFRALAGLGPVVRDDVWSVACLGHLRYLEHESMHEHAGGCVLRHDEPDLANPHHASSHEQAAAGALLACDRSSSGQLSLGRAVDRWINSLYHRLPLLNPGLVRVGGAAHAGYVCLHYESGTVPLDAPHRVMWPPANTYDVPRSFVGREHPCPSTPSDPSTPALQCPVSGFIMTVTWYGPTSYYPYTDSAPAPSLIRSEDGAQVPLGAWYADGVAGHDPAPGLIPNTVAWVPATPLEQGRRYRAVAGAVSWGFRTGDRME